MAPATTNSDSTPDASDKTVKNFQFVAKDSTVKETDDGTQITVPISGVQEDRDGDKFTDAGLDSLVNQINEGSVPMFPNHGLNADTGMHDYAFQDIMGRWESAERDGDIVNAKATLREGDENAKELVDLLNQDMPVGFSVGFGWDEESASERDEGGLEFDDADLMETSPVGIPSHPNAVAQAGKEMARAVKSAGVDPSSVDTDALAKSLKQSMTDETNEGDMPDDEEDEEEQDSKQLDEETVDMAVNLFESIMQSHMSEAVSEFEAELTNADDGEEADEEDGEDEDTEDGEEMDGEGEDDEEYEGSGPDEVESLKSELEELKAELETVKTDQAESSGRKGGMNPADKDTDSEETETKETRTPTEFAENVV